MFPTVVGIIHLDSGALKNAVLWREFFVCMDFCSVEVIWPDVSWWEALNKYKEGNSKGMWTAEDYPQGWSIQMKDSLHQTAFLNAPESKLISPKTVNQQ